jgi:hypothetical protein
LFATIYFWGFDAYYIRQAPTPHYAPPHTIAEAQRDDLEYLRKYPYLDWSYTDSTRAKAEAVIDVAEKHLPMSSAALDLTAARVVALANNGHSNVWAGSRSRRHNRLPIRTFEFADGLYVVRAQAAAQDLLGGRIVAIDGRPIKQVRDGMRRYIGGVARFRDTYYFPAFAESPDLLHAAGYAIVADRETLTVAMPDGTQRRRTVMADPADPKAPMAWPNAFITSTPLPEQRPGWMYALSGKTDAMLLFAFPGEPFVAHALPRLHAYYVRFNANRSEDGHNIKTFCDKTMAAILAARPRAVVIDMRFNGGGDYTMTADFMQGLPHRLPRAKIYVLMSPQTFSAAMTSVAFLKQAGGPHTILVGTKPGDRIRFHAEGGDKFCLPFSNICTSIRTAIHDYSTTDCRPISECYALNWLYPVAIKSFQPQIVAPLTYAALFQGHDPALEAVFPNEGF